MLNADRVATVEIVIGEDRISVAPNHYPEAGGYYPHFLLQSYWNVEPTKLVEISKVIEAVYQQIGTEHWENPVICLAAATALFLDTWSGYQHFLKDQTL